MYPLAALASKPFVGIVGVLFNGCADEKHGHPTAFAAEKLN